MLSISLLQDTDVFVQGKGKVLYKQCHHESCKNENEANTRLI